MKTINDFGIVPVGILAHIYSVSKFWDELNYDMDIIHHKYDDVRHLFAMDLITTK